MIVEKAPKVTGGSSPAKAKWRGRERDTLVVGDWGRWQGRGGSFSKKGGLVRKRGTAGGTLTEGKKRRTKKANAGESNHHKKCGSVPNRLAKKKPRSLSCRKKKRRRPVKLKPHPNILIVTFDHSPKKREVF